MFLTWEQAALRLLDSRRRGSRPATETLYTSPKTVALSLISSIDDEPNVRDRPSLFGMLRWLKQLGHTVSMNFYYVTRTWLTDQKTADINRLNIIHIARTKGKGGTCAYIECLLRAHDRRTGFSTKTELYTSPHLINLEERIRIDFRSLNKEVFARYVSETHEALQSSRENTQNAPRYLQFLALVSFHAFIREGVDVAIYETH